MSDTRAVINWMNEEDGLTLVIFAGLLLDLKLAQLPVVGVDPSHHNLQELKKCVCVCVCVCHGNHGTVFFSDPVHGRGFIYP